MKIVNNIIIQSIKEHKKIKKDILKEILKGKGSSYKTISRTDWKVGGEPTKYFTDIFFPIVGKYYKNITEYYYKGIKNKVTVTMDNYWFQTYLKNSEHSWHTHPRTNLGNVYFVDLPDKKFSTKFFGVEDLPIKEGDLITFPAFMAHSSPMNLSVKKKTILSFNTNMEID
tara:strand:- start:1102 stop:1611 length:510 start_codon:yes stop_codon:yes gene_type:complete